MTFTQVGILGGIAGYLARQMSFSLATFGPGRRTIGVTRHIEKECEEIRAKPEDVEEWIDIIILGMDGYWRAGGTPETLMIDLERKATKNRGRKWPTPTERGRAR
jgi:hypothetical protein